MYHIPNADQLYLSPHRMPRVFNVGEEYFQQVDSVWKLISTANTEMMDPWFYTENAEESVTVHEKLENVDPEMDVNTRYTDGTIVEHDEFYDEVLKSVGWRYFETPNDILWVRLSLNVNF